MDDDWLRQTLAPPARAGVVQNFTQAVTPCPTRRVRVELEAGQKVGAAPHERSPNRLTQRNGYRERGLAPRVGELELRIPKLRTGSFFPSLLEPSRRAEKR